MELVKGAEGADLVGGPDSTSIADIRIRVRPVPERVCVSRVVAGGGVEVTNKKKETDWRTDPRFLKEADAFTKRITEGKQEQKGKK